MNRRTLLDARMSRIAGSIGTCPNDNVGLLETINEAQQRLIMDEAQPDEGWWGTWGVMNFNLTQADPYFTTPRDVARVTLIDICKKPIVLRNQFYEYLEFGNGLRPLACCSTGVCENLGAFDRGPVVSFKDIRPPNKRIRVFATDETDYGKRVLLSGKDPFDNIFYSQDGFQRVTGEFVTLATPFAETVNEFSVWNGVQKDLTNGQVQFHEVDTVTGEMRLLLTMEPSETVGCYRRYFVNGLPNTCATGCPSPQEIQISALVKLDFIPAVADTDYLIIGNLAALKEECLSIRLSEMDSPNAKRMAASHHAAALRLLFGELDLYVGKERVSINVPLWNGDRLRPQPM